MPFALSASLGRTIINELNQLAEIPFEGYLAGGAVANWLLSKVWGTELPINDIDVFTVKPFSDHGRHDATSTGISMTCSDGYGGPISRVVQEGIQRFVGFDRDGLLNTVVVEMDTDCPKEQLSNLLNGFDLNACQAGIDLKSSELVWTKEFEAFIYSKQLQVCYPGTPYQTAVRLVKKTEDLDCYCNIESELKCLSTCIISSDKERDWRIGLNPNDRQYGYRRWFSEKHYDLYLEYADRLEGLVDLVQFDHQDMTDDGSPVDAEDFKELWKFEFLTGDDYAELNDTLKLGEEAMPIHMAKKAWDLLLRPTVSHKMRRRAMNLLSDKRSLTAVTAGVFTLGKDFHAKHATEFFNFIDNHTGLKHLTIRKSQDFTDIYSEYKLIRKNAKRYGDWLIGCLENVGVSTLKSEDFVLDQDYLDKVAKDFLKDLNDDPLTSPVALDKFKHAELVRELITKRALVTEGTSMHHCVGGYTHPVKNGECRIFHISSGEGRGSTIEISFRGRHQASGRFGRKLGKASIAQHRGVNNCDPCETERKIGKELLAYVNAQLGPELALRQAKDGLAGDLYQIRSHMRGIWREIGWTSKGILSFSLSLAALAITAPQYFFSSKDTLIEIGPPEPVECEAATCEEEPFDSNQDIPF